MYILYYVVEEVNIQSITSAEQTSARGTILTLIAKSVSVWSELSFCPRFTFHFSWRFYPKRLAISAFDHEGTNPEQQESSSERFNVGGLTHIRSNVKLAKLSAPLVSCVCTTGDCLKNMFSSLSTNQTSNYKLQHYVFFFIGHYS